MFATTNRPAAAINGYINLFWRIDKFVLAPEIKKRRKRRKNVPQRFFLKKKGTEKRGQKSLHLVNGVCVAAGERGERNKRVCGELKNKPTKLDPTKI